MSLSAGAGDDRGTDPDDPYAAVAGPRTPDTPAGPAGGPAAHRGDAPGTDRDGRGAPGSAASAGSAGSAEPAGPAAVPLPGPMTGEPFDALLPVGHGLGPTGRPFPDLEVPTPPAVPGPARITAVCNQKGGVGKTTTTINVGAALAEMGWRVLLVDFDPQGSLSVGLGLNPHEMERTVYDLLTERRADPASVVVATRVANLDLLPSNIDLSAAELQLVGEVAREFTLQRALRPLRDRYDVILVDCQPSLGLLTVNALTAAHGVLIPLECEFFALRGVALLTDTITKVRERLNPDLVIDGVLGTMYDGRTVHGREVLARVVGAFPDTVFHTVISRTIRFPETTVAGEPITSYAPSSSGAFMYRQVAREFAARALVPPPGRAAAAASAPLSAR